MCEQHRGLATAYCSLSLCAAGAGVPAAAEVEVFDDKAAWEAAAGAYSTLPFTGFTPGADVGTEYEALGAILSAEPAPFGRQHGVEDGWSIDVTWSPLTVTFATPMHAVATDHPGSLRISLFDRGELLFTSPIFGGQPGFGGLISEQAFDTAVIWNGTEDFLVDDIHFGPPIGGRAGASGRAIAGGPCGGAEAMPLVPTGGPRGSLAGHALSFDGDLVMTGAAYDDDAAPSGGSAYLYDVETGAQLHKLLPPFAGDYERFGYAVTLSASHAITGAPYADNAGERSGAAYQFDVGTGAFIRELVPLDAAPAREFGFGAATNGEVAMVGAPNREAHDGSVYVFDLETGVQLQRIDGEKDAGRRLGSSVSVSGDTAVIGEERFFSQAPGSAFVYAREDGGSTWTFVQHLVASNPQSVDRFGAAVAIDGDTIVVGAFLHDVGDDFFAGAAYVFERDAGGPDNWGEVAFLTASDGAEGDYFGQSVAISGDTIIVGCRYDDGVADNTGAAYVYRRNAGGPSAWGEVAKLTAPDASARDNFGNAVAVREDWAVIGSVFRDAPDAQDLGGAYVVELGCLTCPADVTADGVVGVEDLIAVILAWGACERCPSDVTTDGFVDGADLDAVISSWGACD